MTNDGWDDPEPGRRADEWDSADDSSLFGTPAAKSAARRGVRIVAVLMAAAVALSVGQAGIVAISAAVTPSPSPAIAVPTALPSPSAANSSLDASVAEGTADEVTSSDSASSDDLPAADAVSATVTEVVDGDTIHVDVDGEPDKVRIIGLDTPEEHKPNTPVECYAVEADRAAAELLPIGTEVELVADPTQATRDRFDRRLAHVILPDGRLFAEVMIERGLGIHYIYDGVPSIFADRLAAAQEHAKRDRAGLWASTTCRGNPHSPLPLRTR